MSANVLSCFYASVQWKNYNTFKWDVPVQNISVVLMCCKCSRVGVEFLWISWSFSEAFLHDGLFRTKKHVVFFVLAEQSQTIWPSLAWEVKGSCDLVLRSATTSLAPLRSPCDAEHLIDLSLAPQCHWRKNAHETASLLLPWVSHEHDSINRPFLRVVRNTCRGLNVLWRAHAVSRHLTVFCWRIQLRWTVLKH